MKMTDIERMISLADDRYIDEIFQDKITGKRRNIFVTFAAVAAALALTVAGISYLVSNADKSNDITTDMPAVSMEDITDNTETEPKMQEVAYADFFKNKSDYPASFYIEWSSEFYGDKQMSFDETYVKTILPFSAEGYSKTRDQFYLYTDENDIPFGASIYFESPFDENASPKIKSISVNVCDKGKLSYPFPIEKFEPINYMYTDIYGFDDTEGYSYTDVYESVLTAYFTAGGSEYSVSTKNLPAEETMRIVESLIQSGFSAKDFDLSMGGEFEHETTILNFDTANSTEPFAGYVPMVDGLFYLYNDGVTYCTEKMNGKLFSQYMAVVYYDGTEGDGKRVMLEYYTSGWVDKTSFDNVTDLMSVSRKDLGNFMADGEYKFTIKCDGFNINVTAKCGHDELWTYIDAIKGDVNTTGVSETFEEITLAEANHIAPFAGYVPQADSIGTMRVTSVYYDESTYIGGGDIAVIVNLMDDNDKNMIIHYGTFKEKVRDKYVPIAEVYDRFESFSEQSKYNTDCRLYKFTIDCGNFWIKINADCTPEEMQEFLNIIIAADEFGIGSLEYSNNLEPFEGYVPVDKTGYNRDKTKYTYDNIDGEPILINMHLDFSEGESHIMLDYRLYDVSFGSNGEDAIPLNDITPEILEPIFGDGTNGGFSIDCGKFFIVVHTENYSAEDVWAFVSEIKEKPFLSFEF